MSLPAGYFRSGGHVFDGEGRRVFLPIAGGAPLDPTHVRSGGRVLDPDGREVIVLDGAANSGATAGGVKPWAAATAVVQSEARTAPDGTLIISNAARTTGASFDATEATFWTSVGVDTADLEASIAAKPDSTIREFPEEAGVIATGARTKRLYFPVAKDILGISAFLRSAPTSPFVIDVNQSDGSTIFTDQALRTTVPAGALFGPETVPSIASVPAGGFLTYDVDAVGTSPTVTKVGTSAGAGSGTSSSSLVNRPAGAQVGDIHLFFLMVNYSGAFAVTVGGVPAGLTQIGTGPVSSGSSGAALYAYWFRDDGVATSWNFTGIAGHTWRVLDLVSFRGCVPTGDPIESKTVTSSASNTTWSNAGVTPTSVKSALVSYITYNANVDANNTGPAGWTNVYGPSGIRAAWWRNPAAAAATGTITVSDPGGTARNAVFGVFSLAPDTAFAAGSDLQVLVRCR